MNDKKRPLYIPIKTLDSDDYIEGIGKLELALISGSVLSGIILGVSVSEMMNNSLGGVITGMVVSILSIGIFRRDNTNENLIRKLTIIYQFLHAQKKYMYQHYSLIQQTEIGEKESVENDE